MALPKNGIFRKTVGGEEMGKVKGNVNAIIVNASPAVGRIFYAKQWSPDAEPTAPDCFSNDGRAPDAGSTNPQADRCDNCQQNIKGSGQGNSKACRYSRRIALVLEEDFGTSLEGSVYQMNLASKTLFGESVGDNTHTFENYKGYAEKAKRQGFHSRTKFSFDAMKEKLGKLFEEKIYQKIVHAAKIHEIIQSTIYHQNISI